MNEENDYYMSLHHLLAIHPEGSEGSLLFEKIETEEDGCISLEKWKVFIRRYWDLMGIQGTKRMTALLTGIRENMKLLEEIELEWGDLNDSVTEVFQTMVRLKEDPTKEGLIEREDCLFLYPNDKKLFEKIHGVRTGYVNEREFRNYFKRLHRQKKLERKPRGSSRLPLISP